MSRQGNIRQQAIFVTTSFYWKFMRTTRVDYLCARLNKGGWGWIQKVIRRAPKRPRGLPNRNDNLLSIRLWVVSFLHCVASVGSERGFTSLPHLDRSCCSDDLVNTMGILENCKHTHARRLVFSLSPFQRRLLLLLILLFLTSLYNCRRVENASVEGWP